MTGAKRCATLLLALAACSSPGSVPREPEAPTVASCRVEARRDPAVRALGGRINPSNPTMTQQLEQEERIAEARAFRTCLQRAGLAAPGGVEPMVRE